MTAPASRAEMLRAIADMVADGLPVPTGIRLAWHYRSIDLDLHGDDATASAVERWADCLSLPEPSWGDEVGVRAHKGTMYRAYKTSGRAFDCDVDVTAYIDIDKDSTGLEGSGWLERVWVASGRRGIAAHRPVSSDATACGRSTRTGMRTSARQAHDQWEAKFGCRRCWPDGSPITTPEGGGDRG